MARFRSKGDPGFVSVLGELIRLVRDIEEDQRTSLRQKITPQSSSATRTVSTPNVSKPLFMVPYDRDCRFIRREDIITRIDEALEHHQRVALAGIGGVGKSQIVIEYAYRYRKNHPESHVFWVYAAEIATFDKAYQELARKLKVPGWDVPGADIRTLVSEWLSDEANGHWLMILDNADDARLFFPKHFSAADTQSSLVAYLPLETNKNGTLLITTRDRRLGLDLANQLEPIAVQTFLPENAMQLLQSKANWDDYDSIEAEKLLKTLGYIPLAITQAATFMKHYGMSLKEYAALILKEEAALTDSLDEELQDPRRQTGFPNSVFRTWKLSFERLKRESPRAADMLSLIAYLDRKGIPKTLLRDEGERELQFVKAIGELQGLSLVTTETGGETFTVHRLVQLSIQNWLRFEDKQLEFQAEALGRVSESFPNGRFETWDKCRTLYTHAEVVLEYNLTSDDSLLDQGNLLSRMASYNTQRGQYAVAEKLCRRTLEVRTKVLSPRDVTVLDSHGDLAAVLMPTRWGDLEEAEQRGRWAMEGFASTLGPEDRRTLTSMCYLANALRMQGKYKAAEELLRHALGGQEKILGLEESDTLATMSDLAAVLGNLGDYKAAEEMCRRTLQIQEKIQGLEHPNTLFSLFRLGWLLVRQGKYEEAEDLCRRALEGQEKILAPDHPATLPSVLGLAHILDHQGRFGEASALYRRALTHFEKTYGMDDWGTIGCASALTKLLAKMNEEQAREETT